jgi:release factor glutamine methyltransferase
MNKDKTVRDLVQYIRSELGELYPENEIRSLTSLIFQKATPLKKNYHLHLYQDITLKPEHYQHIKDITKQLKSGKPIQQILEEAEFYGLSFKITPSVLIPRQETEELVDWIIHDTGDARARILDVGTGSGCIAISLAKNLKNARVDALDFSTDILDIARENARLNQVELHFFKADILQDDPIEEQYNLIVSNPPYVRESEKRWMHTNVLGHEPEKALMVEDDQPLRFYRKIMQYAGENLLPGGTLYFEINEAFGEEMKLLLQENNYRNITLKKDLNQKDRMIKAEKP